MLGFIDLSGQTRNPAKARLKYAKKPILPFPTWIILVPILFCILPMIIVYFVVYKSNQQIPNINNHIKWSNLQEEILR